jgi:ectoine hydroxylase-related dioxygenase (phytanoyl-CoA dioxygenase family)
MKGRLKRAITEVEIETFQRDGVVRLAGILPREDVAYLAEAIDDAVARLAESTNGYDLTRISDAIAADDKATLQAESGRQYDVAALGAYIRTSEAGLLNKDDKVAPRKRGHFILDSGVAARLPDFKRFATEGQGPQIAHEILRSEKINFWDDQLFVKEPGTQERTAYHQDGPYFHFEGTQACTVWIPVDPVGAESGLRYLAGSHKSGKFYTPNLLISRQAFPGAPGEPMPDIDGHEEDFELLTFDMEPGDVLVHHPMTVHGAPGNRRLDRMRRATGIRYCGDDVRYRFRPYAPPQPHHKHDLKDGDLLDSAQFPVVWPRPAKAQRKPATRAA